MDKNKIGLGFALFTTGLTGVLLGALIVSKPIQNISIAAQDKPNAIVEKYEGVEKLSKNFISVSKNVTPAVVSIYSTKTIKQKNKFHEFMEDPYLRKFFDIPDGQGGDKPRKEQGLGSGVIVDPSGIILTNNHVIDGADEIKVILSDKRRFKAKVLGADPKTDVAVVKLEKAHDLPVAKLGDSSKLEVGEWVLAIGNPLGLTSTVTSGIISAKSRADVGVADFEDFIQTDAAINPGNSGGALVNLNGDVIGVNTAIASKTGGYMGIGFAIPINMAKKVMNDLVTKGKVSRGFLGIQIQNMTESMAKGLKLDNPSTGIVVGDVVKGSPADKSGIKRYDIILELNGKEVSDVNSFRNTIAGTNPGESVKLKVLRDGNKIDVTIKISELQNTKESIKTEDKQEVSPDKKLGFEIEPLTKELLRQLGISKSTTGVIIADLDENSNAAESGIMKGDIIQEINKIKIEDISDFNKAVKEIKSGDSVLLKVLRGQNTMLLAFTQK